MNTCGSFYGGGALSIGVGAVALALGLHGRHGTQRAPSRSPAPTAQYPSPVYSGSSEAQNAVDQIRSGPHGTIPSAQAVGTNSSGATTTTIRNSTQYTLYVYLAGPSAQVLTIYPGGAQSVTLAAGSYEKGARVSDPSVTPFYGQQFYGSGTAYSESFYIQVQPQ